MEDFARHLICRLSPDQIETIHRNMLRIVSEVGMKIESGPMLDRMAEYGGIVDKAASIVRFSPEFVEAFIADSDKVDWDAIEPQLNSSGGMYVGRYLDPETDRFERWSEDRIRKYAKLAHYLPEIDGVHMFGCPIQELPAVAHPLWQRYLAWKHGARSGGSIWDIRLCPYILEMCEVMAQATGRKPSDYFAGAVYLNSPLRLAASEAEHFLYFTDRGMTVGIGHMMSAGGSAPTTLAGAITLFLAESMFINIIRRAYCGAKILSTPCTISVLDMKSLMYPYGRPERVIANVMMAQVARWYGASYSGHCGHSDAKRPSCEAGAQKVMTALPVLMVGGRASIGAGLLSVDEVFSPIQMILDNEIVGALRRIIRGCEISDETIAVDLIKEIGPGGFFTDTDHTARTFRTEHWQPTLWAREMYGTWAGGDTKTDLERAVDIYHEIMDRLDPPRPISDETEEILRAIVERAVRDLS
ncbi:MAG: trimethylamine methyltransferase family protein [Planctomycetota bacterium]